MPIQALATGAGPVSVALDLLQQAPAAGGPGAGAAAALDTLRQGRRQLAAQALGQAHATLESAVKGATLLMLFGGDGRALLGSVRDAMEAAADGAGTLSRAIVDDVRRGDATQAEGQAQLGSLSDQVLRLDTLATSFSRSPALDAKHVPGPLREAGLAALRDAGDRMKDAVAGGRLGLAGLPAIVLTV